MFGVLEWLDNNEKPDECSCAVSPADRVIDTSMCDGSPITTPACRRQAVNLVEGCADRPLFIRDGGIETRYAGDGVELLAAAGRFAALAERHDPTIAAKARRDPLAAARAAVSRAGPVSDIAAESGLQAVAKQDTAYDSLFEPAVRPRIGNTYLQQQHPPAKTRSDTIELPNGGIAQLYSQPQVGKPLYWIQPPELDFPATTQQTLHEAYKWLATATPETTEHDPLTALQAVLDEEPAVPFRQLYRVLTRYTTGYGVIEALFSDEAVSDIYISAPAAENPIEVRRDGKQLQTNAVLSEAGAAALASRVRRETGRSFSRAAPTVDATTTIAGTTVRVTGVTAPATTGMGFAFRSGGTAPFTIPALIENETLPDDAAGLLSLAVRRDSSMLIAGTRGAGKTTLLGALLWELPADTRTITIEDTPELPVDALQRHGRDVQPLQTTLQDGPGVTPDEALKTALRLGDSALVMGEVRGEEARVLYEAMRVGANEAAVLGTIHGDSGPAVQERVTVDLGVPESAFATTDLIVTVEPYTTPTGDQRRRVKRIEEVIGDETVRFEPLYTLAGEDRPTLASTGRLKRGNSHLLEHLAQPHESYAEVLTAIDHRSNILQTLSDRGEHSASAVTTAYARQATTHA